MFTFRFDNSLEIEASCGCTSQNGQPPCSAGSCVNQTFSFDEGFHTYGL